MKVITGETTMIMSPKVPCRVVEFLRDVFRILSTVVEKEFDICSWLVNFDNRSSGGTCGTVACAIGWCMRDEAFMTKYDLGMEGKITDNQVRFVPKSRNAQGFSAIRDAMGLPPTPAQVLLGGLEEYIFGPHAYASSSRASAEDVRERIQEVIGTIAHKVIVNQEQLGFHASSGWGRQIVRDINYVIANS